MIYVYVCEGVEMGKGRSPCCDKSKVKRGPWSPAEDLKLITFIQNHGHANWRSLPAQAGLLRCGKSCRLRWINYLRPDLKRGNITPEEEETIIKLHETHGNKWSKIASFFPGRTDNEIKNIWNTHIAKKLGIKYVRRHASKRKKSKKSSQDPVSSPSRSSLIENDDMDRDSKTTMSLGNIKVRERTALGETQGCRARLREYEEEQGESPTPSLISCLSNVLKSQEHGHGRMDTSFDMSLKAMDVDGSRASNDETFQTLHDFEETDFWNTLELDNLCPLQCFEIEKNTPMSNAYEDLTSSDSGNKVPDTSNVEPYSWIRYLEIELGLDA